MSMFDQLHEAHSVARARATEDFEFFVNGVLSLGVPSALCVQVQKSLEGRALVPVAVYDRIYAQKLEKATLLWNKVLNGEDLSEFHAVSETFSWLFAERAA